MLKVKVPQTIQVGGHIYSIWFNRELDDEEHYGVTHHRKLTIEINPTRPESQQVEALWHEWLHLVNNTYCNRRLDEEMLEGLSEGLCQVWQQLGITLDWGDIKEIKA